MKKNKFILILALFLINIITIPIAYAQAATGFNWVVFIINTVIVFIVLFLLQAVLIPRKNEKERTSVWTIILLTSLLIAFFFGREGFIWQTGPIGRFFSTYVWYVVLVNTAIIAAIAYFLLGLMKVNQNLKSPEGNTGYGILIFLVAFIFAVRLGNNWIWNIETALRLRGYLLGPEGILNPNPPFYRLWIFLSSAILLAFFFSLYVKADVKGGTAISYALAILMASTIASAGASINAIIQLAEVIFVIFLADALHGKVTDEKFRWSLGIFLVGWASAALTSAYPQYTGFIGGIVGRHILSPLGIMKVEGATTAFPWFINLLFSKTFLLLLGGLLVLRWFGGDATKKYSGKALITIFFGILAVSFLSAGFPRASKIFLVLIIPLAIIGIIFFGMARGEKTWEFKKLWERYRRLIRNKFVRKVDEVRAKTYIYDKAWMKRRVTPDMLPQILKENLVILFSLSNYMKRMYIWNVKFGQVKNARVICKDMYEFMDIHMDKDIKELEEEIFKCRNGEFSNGRYGPAKITLIDPEKNEKMEIEVGVFYYTKEFCEKLNDISAFLSDYLKRIVEGMLPIEYPRYQSGADGLRTNLTPITDSIVRSYRSLDSRAHAYGNHQPIKAQKYLVLDQCNPYGWHEHQYKFIGPGTKLSDNSRVSPNQWLEVNQYYEVLVDKYNNSNRFYSLQKPPRKVHPDEIKAGKVKDLWPPAGMMDAVIVDWEGFIRNMRYGAYRPNSKSVQDYLRALATLGSDRFFIENNIPITKGWKTKEYPAFDRRALVDPGLLKFVGRRNYMESYEDVKKNPKTDPYPALSSYGMSLYIPPLVIKDTENIEEVNEYLKVFLRDTGTSIESFKDVLAALGALHAEEKK